MPFGHAWIVLLILLAIVLVVFGPGKLSQLGGALGKSVREFRKTSQDPDNSQAVETTKLQDKS